MNVYIEEDAEQHRWFVHMDQWHVGFRTPEEAEQFMERLTARLHAPHSWEMVADCPGRGHTIGMDMRHAANSLPSLGHLVKEA